MSENVQDSFVADEEGRLDEIVAAFYTSTSLGGIRRAIDAGRLTLNGRRAARSAPVSPGDLVAFDGAPLLEAAIAPAAAPLQVLFDDEHLIVVDKPPGVPVVPERGSTEWLLMGMLLGHARGCRSCAAARFRIVHRLDRDTSGVLAVAKTLEAARALSEAFGLGRVEKEYLALVRGEPPGEAGVIDAPVARAGGGRRLMRVASGGKASRTEWRVRERFAGYALLEVTPRTGRTHQIRVHLAHEGMPLAVDDMYGGAEALLLSDFKRGYRKKGREKPLLSRLSLHCARLRFEHPATGLPVSAAAAPGDFERALKALAKYAARPTAGQQ